MPKHNSASDIWKYIDTKNNDPSVCWPWSGALSGSDGRGYFSFEGKRVSAHRFVFEMFNGKVDSKLVIRHKCDNPACCNPTHLEPGTRSDNEKDKYLRDRAGYTDSMLREMRRMFRMGMYDKDIKEQIDKTFKTNVSVSGIGQVRRGERRKLTISKLENSK